MPLPTVPRSLKLPTASPFSPSLSLSPAVPCLLPWAPAAASGALLLPQASLVAPFHLVAGASDSFGLVTFPAQTC